MAQTTLPASKSSGVEYLSESRVARLISDGPHGAVRLLLLRCIAKTVDARVAVHVERAGAVGQGVLVGEDQKGAAASSARIFAHCCFHGWRELNLDSLLEGGRDRVDPPGQTTQEFAIVPYTAE